MSKWLSVSQVREVLGVSEPKAYRLIEEHGLPAYMIGSRIKVREDELQNWIDSKRIVPGSSSASRGS